jgi:hypothetical protein
MYYLRMAQETETCCNMVNTQSIHITRSVCELFEVVF